LICAASNFGDINKSYHYSRSSIYYELILFTSFLIQVNVFVSFVKQVIKQFPAQKTLIYVWFPAQKRLFMNGFPRKKVVIDLGTLEEENSDLCSF